MAIVADRNAAYAAAIQPHLNGSRASINGVLEQFFQDRGRAFDYFAGGDLADQ
jgi:hypothetical protein